MSDAYAYWKAKVRGEDATAYILPTMYTGTYEDPQPGAYKVRLAKGGQEVLMRIWLTKDGAATATWSEGCELAGTIDGKPVDAKTIAERWIWAKEKPASKEEVEHYKKHKIWPGDIGHNSGDLSLAEDIKDTAEQVKSFLKANAKIADKATGDMAANYRDKLNGLKDRAEDELKEKLAPLKEQEKALRDEYKPLITACTDSTTELKKLLQPWLTAIEDERKAKLEKLKAAADELNLDVPLSVEPARAGGQRGRRTGLRSITKYECHDLPAVMEALKDNAELHAAAIDIARKLMKNGANIPGMQVVVERIVA